MLVVLGLSDDHGRSPSRGGNPLALLHHQVMLLTLFVRAQPGIIQGYSIQGCQGYFNFDTGAICRCPSMYLLASGLATYVNASCLVFN